VTATALWQRDGKVTATAEMVGATALRQRWRNCDTTLSKDNACTDKAVSVGETFLRWRGGANRQAGHEHDDRSDEGARHGPDECPAKTGRNPKALPKSGLPFAASIENVLSGVEGEDDFVLEGPAAGAKGARAQNMIATPSRSWHQRSKPMKKWAHSEALPIVSARRSTREHIPPPGQRPPSTGSAVRGIDCPNPWETGPRESAAHCFFWGRHSIGGITNQASPRSTTSRHAHDPQQTP